MRKEIEINGCIEIPLYTGWALNTAGKRWSEENSTISTGFSHGRPICRTMAENGRTS